MKSFIHIGDPHLRRRVWSNRPEINGDAFYAFEFAISKCVELGANAVVPGDLFNSPNLDPDGVQFFNCREKGFEQFLGSKSVGTTMSLRCEGLSVGFFQGGSLPPATSSAFGNLAEPRCEGAACLFFGSPSHVTHFAFTSRFIYPHRSE
jgi:hypothetical protein